MRRIRVALTTLGCKVNAADAETLLSRLGAFAAPVPFEEEADLYIVNSCTVTGTADRQTRQLLFRARRRNPSAKVVLTGCFAMVDPSAAAAIAGVDRVFTPEQHAALARYAEELASRLDGPSPETAVGSARGRPFLKIQDGCDRACSYCIVPRARGASRSSPTGEVLARLRALEGEGYQEIVLSGIHLGGYGRDLSPATDLPSLVRRAREERIGVRIRLSSVEPDEVTPALVEEIRSGIVCPHLHLPVQAGDDEILAAMNRPYRSAQVWTLLADLRAGIPTVALGADLIVGFPGEGERQFARSLELVEQSPLTHLHIFPFSPLPGTPAASLPGRVPAGVVRARAAALRAAGREKLARFAAAQVGARRVIVVERVIPEARRATGTTENYLRAEVALPSGVGPRPGERMEVLIESSRSDRVVARWVAPTATS